MGKKRITEVAPDSPAARAGIRPEERLVSVNGHDILDALDYRFYGAEAGVRLEIEGADGKVRAVTLDNEAYEAEHGIRRTADGKELDLSGDNERARIHYQSNMAAFIQLGAWFDELRAQGVYDNTRIIVVSDHGCYLGLTGVDLAERTEDKGLLSRYLSEEWTDTTCYNPLLMVKDFGAAGFTTDNRFMTNAETPALAFEGTVENAVNPFTGNAVTGEAQEKAEHHVVESDWHIVTNNGNTYSDPLRITFRGTDVFDPTNWSVEN